MGGSVTGKMRKLLFNSMAAGDTRLASQIVKEEGWEILSDTEVSSSLSAHASLSRRGI
tara:strand:+ start:474 stop:647 length:174 start_codon:yes stop_codon:yes gene_type:complete